MFERLLGKVADDMVRCSSYSRSAESWIIVAKFQRVGIDRPSFGAMVIKNQSRFHLSQRESAWVVGEILCVPYDVLRPRLESLLL